MKRYTEQQIKELAVAYMTARKNADTATADFFGSLTTDGALEAYDRFTTATAYLNGFTAVLDLLELTPEELVELATEED